MIELRCEGTLLGRMVSPYVIEISCRRRRCGKAPGTVVLHTLDTRTGELLDTQVFADPNDKERKS